MEANEEEGPLTAVGAWASSARVVLAVRGDFDSGVVEPDDTDPPKISTGALPSSSIRSSMKKAMAASRSATTMPTGVHPLWWTVEPLGDVSPLLPPPPFELGG